MKNRVIVFLRCKAIVIAMLCIGFGALSAQPDNWSIVATYSVPGKASGLAWDGTYIYFGIYGVGGDRVHRFDPATGTSQLQFSNPVIGDSYGMTFDGQHLWIIDRGATGPSFALQLTLTGTVVSQFNLPDQFMSGIAWDAGNFWVCTYHPNPGTVYKVTGTGAILSQFVSPNTQPWDIAKHGDHLWIVDYDANMIYRVTQTGTVLESHPSITARPAGIVHDGTYIWYVAGPVVGNSTLYKVNLGGVGTPEIQIPVTNHNFGTVAVGSTATWNMVVNSTGTAPLQVTGITFPFNFPVSTTTTFPITIPAGQSALIPLIFAPTTAGPLNGIIQVNSNAPLTPTVNVTLTGNAVFVGPNLHVPVSSFNFGSRRLNSTTRWQMQAQNNGNEILTIDSLQFSNPAFYFDGAVTFPLNLAPLSTTTFNIWFQPAQAMVYNESLSIFSNDPQQNPFVVALSGSATVQTYPIGVPLWNHTIAGGYDNSPKAITWIPDITGDGIHDVIICSEDFYVRCFNGNASGHSDVIWERRIHAGSVFIQNALAIISDIDNDGYDDVIVGTAWGDRAVVALSGKTGEILWKYYTDQFGDGGWIHGVCTRHDYSGDGFPDVLAASGDDENNQGPRRVFFLNGKNGTVIRSTFLDGQVFSVIGIPDVNDDGIPDVVAGATNAAQLQGIAYGINGANGSVMWSFNTTGTSVWALTQVNDINGDGKPEVAIGSFHGTIYLVNPVNGTILHQTSIGNNIITRLVRLDDINGDGNFDLFPAHSGLLAVALDGSNLNTIWAQSMPDMPRNVERIPDVSGDFINDVVVGTLFQNNYVLVLDGINGNTLFSVNYNTPVDAITSIPDITGDLSWEIVAGGRDGTVVCFSGGIDVPTGIRPATPQPDFLNIEFAPNPFSDHTTMYLYLPADGKTKIRIYDLNGSVVFLKNFGYLPAGNHTFRWDGRNQSGRKLPIGIFIPELESNGKTRRTKLIHVGE